MAIVCVDLDGTVSADPSLFRAELRGLTAHGFQVHVLTGNPHAEDELTQMGFTKGRDYSTCVHVPRKHIARFKVAYMRHVGATTLIDNRAKNIKAARQAGFVTHWVRPPKKG